jgi:hypothetical protein
VLGPPASPAPAQQIGHQRRRPPPGTPQGLPDRPPVGKAADGPRPPASGPAAMSTRRETPLQSLARSVGDTSPRALAIRPVCGRRGPHFGGAGELGRRCSRHLKARAVDAEVLDCSYAELRRYRTHCTGPRGTDHRTPREHTCGRCRSTHLPAAVPDDQSAHPLRTRNRETTHNLINRTPTRRCAASARRTSRGGGCAA